MQILAIMDSAPPPLRLASPESLSPPPSTKTWTNGIEAPQANLPLNLSTPAFGHEGSKADSGVSKIPYFICLHCGIPRGTRLVYDGICIYCFDREQKYCIPGGHEEDRSEFIDLKGTEHHMCNLCRADIPAGATTEPDLWESPDTMVMRHFSEATQL